LLGCVLKQDKFILFLLGLKEVEHRLVFIKGKGCNQFTHKKVYKFTEKLQVTSKQNYIEVAYTPQASL
jgi:hypothetical protein